MAQEANETALRGRFAWFLGSVGCFTGISSMKVPMSEANFPLSVVERRRTSPEAKWLINEAAALRGELARNVAHQSRWAKREAEIRKTLAAIELVAAPLPVPAGADAPESVHAHFRYGRRGRLNELLLEGLSRASPKGMDSRSLADWVATCCDLKFVSATDLVDYRRLVSRRLRHLSTDGKVERLDRLGAEARGARVWRLAGKNNVTLGELAELAAKVEESVCTSDEGGGGV